MDDDAIAIAIATVLQAVTPPTGALAIRWASHLLTDDGTPPRPALEILPPEETIEWLPSRQVRSTTDWRCQLIFDSGADLPRRMSQLYGWRKAIRTQLATRIQLGLPNIETALLVGMSPPEDEFGQQLIDALELQIRVVYRGPVSTMSA